MWVSSVWFYDWDEAENDSACKKSKSTIRNKLKTEVKAWKGNIVQFKSDQLYWKAKSIEKVVGRNFIEVEIGQVIIIKSIKRRPLQKIKIKTAEIKHE